LSHGFGRCSKRQRSTSSQIALTYTHDGEYEADIRRYSSAENAEHLLIYTRDAGLKEWLQEQYGFEARTRYLRKDRERL